MTPLQQSLYLVYRSTRTQALEGGGNRRTHLPCRPSRIHKFYIDSWNLETWRMFFVIRLHEAIADSWEIILIFRRLQRHHVNCCWTRKSPPCKNVNVGTCAQLEWHPNIMKNLKNNVISTGKHIFSWKHRCILCAFILFAIRIPLLRTPYLSSVWKCNDLVCLPNALQVEAVVCYIITLVIIIAF